MKACGERQAAAGQRSAGMAAEERVGRAGAKRYKREVGAIAILFVPGALLV
jgi:hypothetical protein